MKSRVLYFLLSIAYARNPPCFVNKEVYIIMLKYSHYRLVDRINDFDGKSFSTVYKTENYLKTAYNDVAMIRKSDKRYTIKLGEKYICSDNLKVVPCSEYVKNNQWEINKLNFGYSISNNDFCLTVEGDTLAMEKCDSSSRQHFDFEEKPPLLICIEQLVRPNGQKLSRADKKKKENVKKMIKNLDQEELADIQEDLEDKLNDSTEKDSETEEKKTKDKRKSKINKIIQKLKDKTYNLSWWDSFVNWLKEAFCP